MTARATPYPPAGFAVRIPEPLWTAALDELRQYATLGAPGGTRGSEGLVYFGGIPAADALVVTSLFRLHHESQGDCVRPTRAGIRWLLTELRQRDEKLIAQLHSHRHTAHHSAGDDEMATSFHEGFLSIVAPCFAVGVARIDQCIVHEYRGGMFRAMSAAETAGRLKILAQLVDRPSQLGDPNPWDRFVRKLKQTARVRRWRPKA